MLDQLSPSPYSEIQGGMSHVSCSCGTSTACDVTLISFENNRDPSRVGMPACWAQFQAGKIARSLFVAGHLAGPTISLPGLRVAASRSLGVPNKVIYLACKVSHPVNCVKWASQHTYVCLVLFSLPVFNHCYFSSGLELAMMFCRSRILRDATSGKLTCPPPPPLTFTYCIYMLGFQPLIIRYTSRILHAIAILSRRVIAERCRRP